jgi:histidinol phosphatase-like PHP family hydrolase
VFLASDAHAVPHLEFDAWACAIAMKADFPQRRILNGRHAEEVQMWLEERR